MLHFQATEFTFHEEVCWDVSCLFIIPTIIVHVHFDEGLAFEAAYVWEVLWILLCYLTIPYRLCNNKHSHKVQHIIKFDTWVRNK